MSMPDDALTCAAGIAPERLSALRDEALAPDEAQMLRAHITECAACRSRLADYEALAAALRQQRELEPGDRVVAGVRARLAAGGAPRRFRPSRRMWAGLATLAPVAAIILLFVYVFSGLASRGQPAAAHTPTVAAPTPVPTNQFGKPIYPTATPEVVTLPPMTASVSASAAWGALSPVATYQTPKIANTAFALDTLSPDATTIVGTETSNADLGSGPQKVYLISYDIASGAYKRLGPQWSGYGGPWGAADGVSADYISYGFNSQPGATCGVCNNTLWAYDRQTGATWEYDPGKQYGGGALGSMTSADHVAFTPMSQQVWVANLATHQVTLALPVGAQPLNPVAPSTTPQANVRLDGFVWPNLIYEYTPPQANANTPVNTTLRITNLQTNVTTIMSTPLTSLFSGQYGGATIAWAGISGNVLYFTTFTQLSGVDTTGAPVNVNYGMLFQVNLSSLASQPTMLARWEQSQVGQAAGNGQLATFGANNRLIIVGGGYVWDIAEGKLVRLPSTGASQTPVASLSGNYLLLTHTVSALDPQTPVIAAAIYDTTTLPVR